MSVDVLFLHLYLQLGLAEKNILHYDFDLGGSDPSDANTNSTNLFSDDTDDKSRRSTNPEPAMPTLQENEVSGILLMYSKFIHSHLSTSQAWIASGKEEQNARESRNFWQDGAF